MSVIETIEAIRSGLMWIGLSALAAIAVGVVGAWLYRGVASVMRCGVLWRWQGLSRLWPFRRSASYVAAQSSSCRRLQRAGRPLPQWWSRRKKLHRDGGLRASRRMTRFRMRCQRAFRRRSTGTSVGRSGSGRDLTLAISRFRLGRTAGRLYRYPFSTTEGFVRLRVILRVRFALWACRCSPCRGRVGFGWRKRRHHRYRPTG